MHYLHYNLHEKEFWNFESTYMWLWLWVNLCSSKRDGSKLESPDNSPHPHQNNGHIIINIIGKYLAPLMRINPPTSNTGDQFQNKIDV